MHHIHYKQFSKPSDLQFPIEYYNLFISLFHESIINNDSNTIFELALHCKIKHFSFSTFIFEYAIIYDTPQYLIYAFNYDKNFKNYIRNIIYDEIPEYLGPNIIQFLISNGFRFRRNKVLKHIEKFSVDYYFSNSVINSQWWFSFIFKNKWYQHPNQSTYKVEFRKYPNIRNLIYNRYLSQT